MKKTTDALDVLLADSKGSRPQPSMDLFSRVLADAGAIGAGYVVSVAPAKTGLLERLLSPIGGWGGAVVLTACTAFGVVLGTGNSEILLTVPGMENVLAMIEGDDLSLLPFETLDILSVEG